MALTAAEATALTTLGEYLAQDEDDPTPLATEGWDITPQGDAFLIGPAGGQRSNRLYLVWGERVVAFSPSETSLETALAQLGV